MGRVVDCEQCGAEEVKRRKCGACAANVCPRCWRYRPCAKFAGGHRAVLKPGSREKRQRSAT